MNRRDFCAGVISTGFLCELMGLKVLGLGNNAFGADSNGLKNYVGFFMSGGAERGWFDAPLTPNGSSDTLGAGPGFYNYINFAKNKELEYRTTDNKVNGKFYLPYLWESKLPGTSGDIDMKDLAVNTAIVRGLSTGLSFDAHGQNKKQVQVPFPDISILGSIADSSSGVLIPGIKSTGFFISHANKSASEIGTRDNAVEILNSLKFESSKGRPYERSASAVMGHRKLDEIVTGFIQSLSSQMPKRSKKAMEVMMDNRGAALKLIEKGLTGISDDYNNAYNKYMLLIGQVMSPDDSRRLEGLDNKSITGSGTRFRLWTDIEGRYGTKGLAVGFETAQCATMASAFAKAEVYLKHGITNCMQFEISGIDKISDDNSQNDSHRKKFGFDCHYTGDLMRAMAFSRYYQSFATCMLEFRSALGGDKWGETLVNLRSEFNRGIAYERGSDHGIRACIESYFSGAIKEGPIVAGNIYDKFGPNTLAIGDGAPVSGLGNSIGDSKHNFSTVANLMGFEPSRNHRSYLGVNSGKIESLVEPPKNIKKAS